MELPTSPAVIPANPAPSKKAFKLRLIVKPKVSFNKLLKLRQGPSALERYNDEIAQDPEYQSPEGSVRSSAAGKRKRAAHQRDESVASIARGDSDDEDELSSFKPKLQKTENRRITLRLGSTLSGRSGHTRESTSESQDSEGSVQQPARRSLRSSGRAVRSGLGYKEALSIEERLAKSRRSGRHLLDEDVDELTNDGSDFSATGRNRRKTKSRSSRSQSRQIAGRHGDRSRRNGKTSRRTSMSDDEESSLADEYATRRSTRTNKATRSMRERQEDEELYADEEKTRPNAVTAIREVFQPLTPSNAFRAIHNQWCDVCGKPGNDRERGMLVFCQGCTTSMHKSCLGTGSHREHLVTKVGEGDFVMQCRRCVGVAKKKDSTAPRLDMCQVCREPGEASTPFSERKTRKQEEKLREENGRVDPVTKVDLKLINNAEIVMFRCIQCHRGFHFPHLPSIDGKSKGARPEDSLCRECSNAPEKVQSLVAWRPADIGAYIPDQTYDDISEDDKEYLVKWQDHSYFRCTWRPGAWVWGVTLTAMRKSFLRRDDGVNMLPRTKAEDAIPEEFLRVDIVLDVKYSSKVSTHTADIDRARINEVEKAMVTYQGLGYEDVVWETPPDPSETERWADFVAAYNEYVAGKYFKQPPPKMIERIDEYRSTNFEQNVLQNEQPSFLVGGKLMEYQLEGLNWLLYNFHRDKNVILADEMGLGKTIQVIGAVATLIKHKPKVWPFLIVVPNSTCPNWRREIKKWAPSLRVVAYYGAKKARDTAMKYELYPDGSAYLKAHIVVTSFDAPIDDHSRLFFQKVKWAGMVVDEGHRLKSDKNLLYGALNKLKVSWRLLLTGTPLQNNKRELFNLLHFLDGKLDAAELDEKYAELTNENLAELHELIKPFFLRRTKVQVLKFLPPMAQVIVPVTMSIVQKKLYKSVLARSPELIKTIFAKDASQLRPAERGNLNNLLMQLRKVLCHPFVYSEAVEERSVSRAVSHRNLVDASAKLQLLEIMLPKLRDRGHRVLIFSQFLKQLNIIEDFLDGLGLEFQRLDGNIGTLEKQKRIDHFNKPDSTDFAFLLSTRAGGVGINLATADTVIIMDPDFNPHQDIQALSRAHRIGQTKKVLVFQLMVKDSAEEKIIQIGRHKMALDHVLIESMDQDDDVGLDLQSILKHGAQKLFEDDDENDIKYDLEAVDRLLDRTQMENTEAGEDKSAESQFSFARVWVNDKAALSDDMLESDGSNGETNKSVWEKILQQREADAAAEAALQAKEFGRGRRRRQVSSCPSLMQSYRLHFQAVDYVDLNDPVLDGSPQSAKVKDATFDHDAAFSSDADFQGDSSDDSGKGVEKDMAGLASNPAEVKALAVPAKGMRKQPPLNNVKGQKPKSALKSARPPKSSKPIKAAAHRLNNVLSKSGTLTQGKPSKVVKSGQVPRLSKAISSKTGMASSKKRSKIVILRLPQQKQATVSSEDETYFSC
jgi:chromodomain-helicase-DNA-binding protein 4